MFVPIYDDNPLRTIRAPFITILLIVANTAIYLVEMSPQGQLAAASFAIVPSELFRVGIFGGPANGIGDALAVPESFTLVTYMFLHGDPFHLFGNMLFLWVFGDNVEDALGHLRFLAFYLACGIFAGLVHAFVVENWITTSSGVPLIGASGAVAGVITAYLMLHPHVRVWVLAFRFIPLRISAMFALGAWILSQIVMLALPNIGPVAWWAHIGGIVAGGVLVLFMRRPGVALFGRRPESAV
ncbi:MAG TPA: rhomboid family intramembrane serine protease [Hyphomicrobiaceae bacterium]|nr:rhomboid family intramembrane serine protease [Hyphomicrobiaceae bacterium]